MNNTLFRSLLVAIIVSTALPAQSQIYKGATFIGGNLGIRQRSEQPLNVFPGGNSSSFSAFINPKAGCYVTKNLAIGLSLHFGFMKNESNQPASIYNSYAGSYSNQNIYSGGGSVFARYTKFIIPRLAFFTEGSIGYVHNWSKSEVNYYPMPGTTVNAHGNGFNVSIIPGIMFMATPRLGFEVSYGNIGYSYRRDEQDFSPLQPQPSVYAPAQSVSEFGLDLSSATVSLGFNYYFGNRPRVKVQEADDE